MQNSHRPQKLSRRESARRAGVTQARQPRPALRRTNTRKGAIAAALKEG